MNRIKFKNKNLKLRRNRAMKDSIYKKVFKLYEISQEKVYDEGKRKKQKLTKEKVRKYINRKLSKEYDGKDWNELTDLEQEKFLYIDIKEAVLTRYVDDHKRDRIKNKIEKQIEKNFIDARIELQKHNDKVSIMFKYFYPNTDDEQEREKAYTDFCNALEKYFPQFLAPTYDTWVSDNEKMLQEGRNTYRIYDYYMGGGLDLAENNHAKNFYHALQTDVDHIIIKTILEILKDKLKIKIDISKIEKCLSITQSMQDLNLEDCDEFSMEIDENSSIELERQKAIINQNLEYQRCKTALEKLDFIKNDVN